MEFFVVFLFAQGTDVAEVCEVELVLQFRDFCELDPVLVVVNLGLLALDVVANGLEEEGFVLLAQPLCG